MPNPAKPIFVDRNSLIKTAALIALFGNAFLAVAKITVGLLFNSLAVVGDGIDSSTDVVIAVMSLAVASVISKPADAGHPWGHGRAETIATTALSFILFFAGGQLIIASIRSMTDNDVHAFPEFPALIVTIVSIFGKIILAWSQFAIGKKAGSHMLMANGVNMRNDVILSSGVLVGLAVSVYARLPFADSITALLVGIWVLRSAFGIFREVNLELMDGTDKTGPYNLIFEAVKSVPGVVRPHRARMRRIASMWDIDLDIEVDGDLTIRDGHKLAEQVEEAIKKRIVDVYDIVIHIEPKGVHRKGGKAEAYGLSESNLTGEKKK